MTPDEERARLTDILERGRSIHSDPTWSSPLASGESEDQWSAMLDATDRAVYAALRADADEALVIREDAWTLMIAHASNGEVGPDPVEYLNERAAARPEAEEFYRHLVAVATRTTGDHADEDAVFRLRRASAVAGAQLDRLEAGLMRMRKALVGIEGFHRRIDDEDRNEE